MSSLLCQVSRISPSKPPSLYYLAVSHHLYRTFLSIDTDGRVLRMDSLSKTMAPGLRLGWLTAPQDFLDKYQLLQEISSQVDPSIGCFLFPLLYSIVSFWIFSIHSQWACESLDRGPVACPHAEGKKPQMNKSFLNISDFHRFNSTTSLRGILLLMPSESTSLQSKSLSSTLSVACLCGSPSTR